MFEGPVYFLTSEESVCFFNFFKLLPLFDH